MAKNEKRISINALDKIAKEQFEKVTAQEWNGVEIRINRSLDFINMMEFVHDAAESCFSESGTFVPEVMDFAIKSNILTRYANFNLPDNLEHRYALIYNTDAVDVVCQHIDTEQLREITSAINRKVNYVCNSNVSVLQQKMNEVVAAFENMQKQSAAMFANVTPDDVTNLLGALSNGTVSEDKIVKAYLEQTRNGALNGAAE